MSPVIFVTFRSVTENTVKITYNTLISEENKQILQEFCSLDRTALQTRVRAIYCTLFIYVETECGDVCTELMGFITMIHSAGQLVLCTRFCFTLAQKFYYSVSRNVN